MFRIRQSYREDAEQILAVAEHLDTVNLPADRKHIEEIVDHSARSFSEELAPAEREYLFVLEDLAQKRVIGTSMIHAQHGTRRAPHIFYRVENDERYSYSLDRYFVHQTLRIGYNYDGPTEIGGLILLPEYRGNPESLGKALSYTRFLFIRMHRAVFRDRVLSELLPPLEADGTSRLWEHLGRHFTGLTYQEADLLSKNNKEFIHALFPDDPIHTELLPAEVRTVIGQVGPETRGVEKMLRRIGFEYAHQIDPFDGGPHFMARTDDITLVRDAHPVILAAVDDADGERPWAVLAVERAGQRPGFRATAARVVPMDDGRVGVTAEIRERLGLEPGDTAWMAAS
ncbi:MAG: arginine N-succinyltransferase [Kofleriaceae bacterium]|nr:arginine N-succinyltransferase [Myxococcales bacterium]MCB9561422.1 arginine N-succinyltransferase [Kofleriaceae bacterium]MCB9573476.1 arginine N-succinyltransferase [Kofleriaceae bacterium]